jgi:predicted hydrolase (HD superfamily)
MTRDEAEQILKSLVKNDNLIKHHLAAEAAMKALYKRLTPKFVQQEQDDWALVGLLHDADYELSKNHPEKHTLILEERIGNRLNPQLMRAIKSHNWKYNGITPKTRLDWSIYCADELTGLIIATALIHPTRSLETLTVDFIMKRFNEPSFAKGANRAQIMMCEKELTIPLTEFIEIILKAMQGISTELGL